MKKTNYLEKIVVLVKDQGLDLSMENIAASIGVTKKTLYNQFVSKELLIEDCMKYMANELENAVACMVDESIPSSEGFRMGIKNMKDKMFDISHVFLRDLQIVYPDKATRDHVIGSQLFENMLRQNLKNGIASGEYRYDINPDRFAQFIMYSIFSYFKNHVMHDNDWATDEYFSLVTEYHLHALLRKEGNGPAAGKTKKDS